MVFSFSSYRGENKVDQRFRRRGYFSGMLDMELRSGIGGWYNIVAPDDKGIKSAIGCYTLPGCQGIKNRNFQLPRLKTTAHRLSK